MSFFLNRETDFKKFNIQGQSVHFYLVKNNIPVLVTDSHFSG